MLETIREYAREKLEAAGEAESTQNAHAAYFLDFAQRAEPVLIGPAQAEMLARLDHLEQLVRADEQDYLVAEKLDTIRAVALTLVEGGFSRAAAAPEYENFFREGLGLDLILLL